LHRFYAIAQIEYCRNFIFRRHFPIHRLFERSCEVGLWRLTADKISEIFGSRITRQLKGKLSAHFAVRGLMHEAALKADTDPDQLSFLHAVRVIRRKLAAGHAIPPSAAETVS